MAGEGAKTALLEEVRYVERFLSGHSSAFARLSAPRAYRPERLLGRIGHTLADPDSLVEGLHIFTFNQVEQTETWRQRLLA